MIGCNFTSSRPICFKTCRIVALRGILQYTKRCHHNILRPDTALRIVLSEWLMRQMIAVYGTSSSPNRAKAARIQLEGQQHDTGV